MKVISKYLKVAFCFLAFALCSFLLVSGPSIGAVEAGLSLAQTGYNVAINSINMPTKTVDASKNDELKIPLLNKTTDYNKNFSSYKVRVIDPAGYNHDYIDETGAQNDTDYFSTPITTGDERYITVNAKNNGEYKIVYILTENGKTYYSNTYRVTVSNVLYELSFEKSDGTTKLIKKDLAVSNEKYELPIAEAREVGKTAKIADVVPVVTVNGTPQTLNATGSVFTKEGDKYYITPSKEGTYSVEYTYENVSNRPSKTYTIYVTDGFVAPTKLKVMNSNVTMPTVELGQENIELPKFSFSAGDRNNVEYNITSIRIEKEDNSNIYVELTNNSYTFDMTPDKFSAESYAEMAGNYRVVYTAVDAYGNTCKVSRKISGVTAKSDPKVYMAYNYTLDATTKNPTNVAEIDTNYAVDLKAEYGYEQIVVPAIYGTDLVTEYKDLILIRQLVNANTKTTYYVDNIRYNEITGKLEEVVSTDIGYNHALPADGVEKDSSGKVVGAKYKNQATSFKFSATDSKNADYAGDYYLEYLVISKEIKERDNELFVSGKTNYSFKVLDVALKAETDKTVPTIEILNVKNEAYVSAKEDISVKVSSKDKDARIKNAVFYYYSNTNATKTLTESIELAMGVAAANKSHNVLDTDEFVKAMAETYKFEGFTAAKVSENVDEFIVNLADNKGSSATIVAIALNDDEKVDVKTKTLNIKKTSETTAPHFTIVETNGFVDGTDVTLTNVHQAKDIYLPDVQFEDKNKLGTGIDDSNLQLSIMYYILPEDATEETKVQYRYPVGQMFNNNTISGAKITTSETGTYYVVYTAIDDAGNTSVVYFTFNVIDTSNPILTVDPVISETASLSGTTITVEAGEKVEFDAIVKSSNAKINYSDKGATVDLLKVDYEGSQFNYTPSGDGDLSYIFYGIGTYTFELQGNYNDPNLGTRKTEAQVWTVVVKAPELKWLAEINVPEYSTKGTEVYLPDIAANHDAVVNVTVKAPGNSTPIAGDAVKVTEKRDDKYITFWKFKTNDNSKGTYVVTYTATADDMVLTEKFEIKVGDNVKPKFEMNYESELKQDIEFTGEDIELSLNVDKSNKKFVVTAKRAGETIYSYDTALKILDKDDTKVNYEEFRWNNFSAVLVDGEGKELTGTDGVYTISSTGKYSIKMVVEDDYDNVQEKLISFNVVEKTEATEKNDAVVGAVLIVISLIVLAGVILFFALTGKKGGSGSKKVKAENEKEESKEEAEKVEESDVKSGDVE